jgi:hypothetical protein
MSEADSERPRCVLLTLTHGAKSRSVAGESSKKTACSAYGDDRSHHVYC